MPIQTGVLDITFSTIGYNIKSFSISNSNDRAYSIDKWN
jgi:hypothetical protein